MKLEIYREMARFCRFNLGLPSHKSSSTRQIILDELCTYVYGLFKSVETNDAFHQLPPQYLYCPEHCKRWYDGVRTVCDRWICSDVALILSEYSFAPSSEMVFLHSSMGNYWYPTETIIRALIDVTPILPMIISFDDMCIDTAAHVTVYFGTTGSFYQELSTTEDPIGFLYTNALCTCKDTNGYYHPVHATLKLYSEHGDDYTIECSKTTFKRRCPLPIKITRPTNPMCIPIPLDATPPLAPIVTLNATNEGRKISVISLG